MTTQVELRCLVCGKLISTLDVSDEWKGFRFATTSHSLHKGCRTNAFIVKLVIPKK